MKNKNYSVRGWKKGKLWIYPQFQIKFIFWIAGATILGILFFYLAELYFLRELVERGKELALSPNHAYFKLVGEQRVLLHKTLVFAGIFLFIYFIIFALILSFRIAGPLIKVRSYFKDLAEGKKITKIQFRKGDFFRDLEDILNKALERNRSKD